MRLPPVVYFGNDWFADNRTSSHHMARQLATLTRVLYVEVPGLRPPAATSRDIKRAFTKLGRVFAGTTRVSGALAVRTVPQLPAHGAPLVQRVNALASLFTVRGAIAREGFRQPIVWCTVPHMAGFVERITRSLLVYYCIDDYAALPGVNPSAVRQMDERLARCADLVVTASRPVFESKQRLNPSTVLLPHGVDVDHFAEAHDRDRPVAPALARIAGPVVGFIGLLERWVDFELIDWLAGQLPEVTFVLVGRVAVAASELPASPNVVVVGPCAYETLPAFGRRFDVAIVPYRLTPQVLAANPLKLREYLAMGLPVVAVSTPEIDGFRDVVTVAQTRGEFLTGIRRALGEGHGPAAIERRFEAVRDASWRARLERLQPALVAALQSRRERSAA